MKIKKRVLLVNAWMLWIVPVITYACLKVSGTQFNKNEYFWLVGISILFIISIFVSFKIEKFDDKKIKRN